MVQPQDTQQELRETGCFFGEWNRGPPEPLPHCCWEDVDQMVIRGKAHGSADIPPSDEILRVDLIPVDAGAGGR
uniref:Uncharacterized protein n=1 Tax=Anguilla anguilla TaxID=7936 RepID=A0A0E9UG28_ANGAN